jgi:hypothetical protein
MGLFLSLNGNLSLKRRSDTSAIPTNSVAPAVTGAAIVGHTLYCSTGTWTGSPTSYTYQWYNDGVAVSGETNNFYEIQDADATDAFRCDVVANSLAGPSDPESSNTTAAVAVPDPDAPTLTRTSASGADPLDFEPAFGAETYADNRFRLTIGADAAFAVLHWDGFVVLTQEQVDDPSLIDWPAIFEAEGVPLDIDYDPLDFDTIPDDAGIKATIFAETPMSQYYYSAESNTILKTDAAVPMTWSTTDKSANFTLSNGNRTATNGGGLTSIRGSRGVSTGKHYWEVVPNTSGSMAIGAAAVDAPLNDEWYLVAYGGSGSVHAASLQNNGFFYTGATETSTGQTYTSPNVVGVALDVDNDKIWFAVNNTWGGNPAAGTGGHSISAMNAPMFPAMQTNAGGGGGTIAGAAADQTYSPPSGFSAFS